MKQSKGKPMKYFILAILGLVSVSAQSGTLSFTGAELLTNTNVSFPTTTPSPNGDSIQFDLGAIPFEKLIVLPILPIGIGETSVSISMNLTRLACVGSCDEDFIDHDPIAALGDGLNLIGARFTDDAEVFEESLSDEGASGNRTIYTGFAPFTMPSVGQNYDIEVTFDLLSNTILTAEGESHTSLGTAINNSQEISFVFMRGNHAGEKYQVNTLTISGVYIY
jgi:hypothetical protein